MIFGPQIVPLWRGQPASQYTHTYVHLHSHGTTITAKSTKDYFGQNKNISARQPEQAPFFQQATCEYGHTQILNFESESSSHTHTHTQAVKFRVSNAMMLAIEHNQSKIIVKSHQPIGACSHISVHSVGHPIERYHSTRSRHPIERRHVPHAHPHM